MQWEWSLYLLLNLFTISIPFIRSFEPRVRFVQYWPHLFKAISIIGLFFILWDVAFTYMGVWGFNERYLSGFSILLLPIEEWLFFITIPYACVFSYVALNYFLKGDFIGKNHRFISMLLIGVSIVVLINNYDKWYTASTFSILLVYMVLHAFVWKRAYMGKFYRAYLFIVIPFFLVNGILTGSFISQEVVWYNNAENMGVRMGTIPVEDLFYGLTLILMNVDLFEYLRSKHKLS